MKGIKIYLGIVTALLVGAIGFGVYIWYTVQTLNTANSTEVKSPKGSERVGTVETENTEAPITISKDSLSPTQQKIVESLGYTQDSFTITAEMIVCAKDAVGEVRYDEITSGAAPTPLESIKLLPCFKK